jgi:hypothetical protein
MATKLQPVQVNMVELLKLVYPVGSIYINASVDTNPATLLGFGTWTAFGAGRVMVGQDTSDVQFDVLEETGGAKTHLLTGAESGIQSHVHNVPVNSGGAGYGVAATQPMQQSTINTSAVPNTNAVTAHNNLQPYITVKMWKRTA